MIRKFFAPLLPILLVLPCASADQVVLVESPPFASLDAALAAAADGYAVAWSCLYDCSDPESDVRVARFDLAGRRIDRDAEVDLGFFTINAGLQIHSLKDGFLLFAEEDAYQVRNRRLDASGQPIGPINTVVTSLEIYPFSVAASSSSFVVTYPEWKGTWFNWSQLIDTSGLPKGDRNLIAEKIPNDDEIIFAFILDSPITRLNDGFATAWSDLSAGVRLRELANNGRPRGDVVSIEPPEGCWEPVAITVAGGLQEVVYIKGCDQGDIYLRTRDHLGKLSPPIALSTDPLDEGHDRCNGRRSLHAVGLGQRLGVLNRVFTQPGGCGDWVFAEYDSSVIPIGSRRNLSAEFGIRTDYDLAVAADQTNNLYALSWVGEGPQGRGVYYLLLDPAR